jgi:DNA modification methylase
MLLVIRAVRSAISCLRLTREPQHHERIDSCVPPAGRSAVCVEAERGAMANKLFYGDNLDVLREHVKDQTVDLVYLDPPFNSNANYNVLFKSPLGIDAAAQIRAFEDTWTWGDEAEKAYRSMAGINIDAFNLLQALRSFLGESDVMAYLAMMSVRLIELKRCLKPTGSLYLHCDPSASHYLKVVMDGIFGAENFRSEIVWRRSPAHNKLTHQYGPIHDTLLFYSRSSNVYFDPGSTPYTKSYITSEFRFEDKKGRYRLNEIMGPGRRNGASGVPWRGYDPTPRGRHWAIPDTLRTLLSDTERNGSIQEQLTALYEKDCIVLSRTGRPKYKQYPGEGVLYQDVWSFQPGTEGVLYGVTAGIDADVKWLSNEDERIGYPTQKPRGLLERIVGSSSRKGDVVLDPFCGCGTAIHASERLGREWVGIDITYLAIQTIEARIKRWLPGARYELDGIPKDEDGARALARAKPYQFQLWAVGRVGGQSGGRGADRSRHRRSDYVPARRCELRSRHRVGQRRSNRQSGDDPGAAWDDRANRSRSRRLCVS